ncbi:MAG: class I SAM-dependent methyltransferase [Coriobacteriia bacterium]
MGESWDGVARAYDRVSRESRAHQDKIARVAALVREGGTTRLLDLGCGSGVLEARLYQDGYVGELTAIDGSAEMVAMARAACGGQLAVVDQVDLNGPLPFADAVFDCAVAVNVLFLLDDPSAVAREVRRTLVDHAGFLVVMPKPEAGSTWGFLREHFRGLGFGTALRETGRLLAGLPAVITTSRFQTRLDSEQARTGSRYLTREQTEALLSAAGFEVRAITDIQARQNWLFECVAAPLER